MGPSYCEPIVIATRPRRRQLVAAVFLTLCISASSADRAKADAGGLSFWLPGIFGSLAGSARRARMGVFDHLPAHSNRGPEQQGVCQRWLRCGWA